jgi:DNA-binding GntR family transcriptional regulator
MSDRVLRNDHVGWEGGKRSMAARTSTKEVYDIIKEKILSCEYEPGQLVSEKEIVEGLETSRTPVREALNILNGQGLLRVIPKKGVQIAPLSIKRIKEIYDIRMLLEPFAVKLAIRNLGPDDIEKLIALDRKLTKEYEEEDVSEVFKTGMDVHVYVAYLSGNEVVYELIKQLRSESHRGYVYYLKRYLDRRHGSEGKETEIRLAKIHNKFIKALIEGNEESAVEYLIEDLSTMREIITGY